MSASSLIFRLVASLILISVVISTKNGLYDDLDAVFRPYRTQNIKTEAHKVYRGLVAEDQKKADCYGRGGYRTYGGGGGGVPPVIIIGVPGAGGAVPGAGAGNAAGGGAGGAGSGGVPAAGTGGTVPAAAPGAGTASGDTTG